MESQQQATAVAESSLTPITGSSNIKAYSYEADEQRLVIQFTNDAAYAYPQVPAETFQSFLASESKGRFFAAHLKGWTGAHRIQLVLHHASTLPAAPGAAPSLPEDQPTGKTYKDVDELFSAMGIPPSSQRMESKPLSPEEEERLIEAGVRSAIAQFGAERFARMLAAVSLPKEGEQEALEAMRALKDAAYEERNKVVAALAKLFPSGIARTAIEGWSDDWHGCVYIDLPTGQVSWHFHDSQAHLFDGLPPYTKPWDGHDTPEKYRRLAALPPSSGGSDEQIARRLVAWDDSGNTQGEHHETLREIINSARAALQAPSPEAGESEPSRRRVVHKKTCVAVVEDGEVIGTFAGPDCERHAAEFAALPAQPQPSGDRQEGNQQ